MTIMSAELILKDKTIAIASHVFTTGPGQELERFLASRSKSVIFVGHPFYYSDRKRTFYRVYENGELVRETESRFGKHASSFYYAINFFSTLLYFIKLHKKVDLFVGVDGLNSLCGLLLRKLGIAKTVVFYVIDYVPNRFANGLLNRLYHWIDKICVKYCDCVWNLSPKMIDEREKRGLPKEKCAPQIIVPIGTNFKTIQRLPLPSIERRTIAYLGALLKKQGVQLVIEVLPDIIKSFPGTKLVIIGTGEYEPELKKMVLSYGLQDHVKFFGEIKNHEDVEKLLSRCAIGVAPYVQDSDNFTKYTDPAKPKVYAACGLPIVITKVPKVAFEIQEKKAGIVIDYSKQDMIRALTTLLTDNHLYNEYRENAIKFAERYDWNFIYRECLSVIFNDK